MELLADNKTFVSTNDSNIKLEMDPLSLETKRKFRWQMERNYIGGVSHSQKLEDGTVISITSKMNKKTLKMDLIVYKLEPKNTH